MSAILNTVTSVVSYPGNWVAGTLPRQKLDDAIRERSLLALSATAVAPISNSIENAVVLGTDPPATYRSFSDLILSVMDYFKGCASDAVISALSGSGAAAVYHSFGAATWLTVPLGIIGTVQDIKNLARKKILGDSVVGGLSLAKNVSLVGAGASFVVFRPLSIFDSIKGILVAFNSTNLTGRVTCGALFVGLVFYTLFFALLSAISGVRLFEGAKLKAALSGKTLEKQIKYLQGKLKVYSYKVVEKLKKKQGSQAAREFLIKEGLKAEIEGLRLVMKELNRPEVSEEKMEELVRKTLDANSIWGADYELRAIGRNIVVEQVRAKKYNKIARVLNKDGVEALNAIAANRVTNGKITGDTTKLIDRVNAAATTKLKENGVLFALGLLGVATMIAAIVTIVCTGGLGLVIAAALMAILCLAGMGVDAYYLYQSTQDEKPAAHDKKMLIASSVLAVASLAAVVGLAASGVVTLGIVPLIVAIVLTALWLGNNGVTWAVMERNARQFNKNHPTLEKFIEAIQNKESYKRVCKMLDNLPKNDREEIASIAAWNGNDKLAAAEAVEKVRKARLKTEQDAWRNALDAYRVS